MTKTQQAIESFTKAIKLDNTKSEFYSNRGFALKKLKNYEASIKDYTNAIRINPSTFIVYSKKIISFIITGLCVMKKLGWVINKSRTTSMPYRYNLITLIAYTIWDFIMNVKATINKPSNASNN